MKDIEEESDGVLKGIESILPLVVERKSRNLRMEIAVRMNCVPFALF